MTATVTTNPFLSFRESVEVHVAAADQRLTLDRVAALTPTKSTIGAPHEWYRTIGIRIMTGLGSKTIRLCPHIGPGRRIGPMFCMLQANPEIQCRDCFVADPPQLDPVENYSCDRCSVYARGLISGALPVGPLMVVFGVCKTCSTELGIAPPAVKA